MNMVRVLCVQMTMFVVVMFFASDADAIEPGDMATAVVSQATGGARYSVPIPLPPGPGGFQPDLELGYSSNVGDGPFGVGWILNLASQQIRCSVRFGVPDYGACPRYELNGQLLTESPTDANRYHPLVEHFARVLYNPAGAATNPDSWEVTLTDGTVQRYGLTSNSRIYSGASVAQWFLSELEDPSGNKIAFSYDSTSDAGTLHLLTIGYGGLHDATSQKRQVEIVYEDRLDPSINYAGGIERRYTKRAREIQIKSYGEVFQRHVLTYAVKGTTAGTYQTARSRLVSLQEFGTDCPASEADPVGSCTGLSPQEFSYNDPIDGYPNGVEPYDTIDTSQSMSISPGNFSWANPPVPQLVGDFDADGIPELIEPDWGASNPPAGSWEAAFAALTFDNLRLEVETVFVLGGGGKAAYSATVSSNGTRPISESSDVLSTPAIDEHPSVDIAARPRVHLLDVNADGYVDVVMSIRLSGVTLNVDAGGNALATPVYQSGQTISIVYRNTHDPADVDMGFVRDDDLARGLPIFDDVSVETPYYIASQSIVTYEASGQGTDIGSWPFQSSCAWVALGQSEGGDDYLCYNLIDLAPRFVDLNGDGYLDVIALERDDPTSRSLWVGNTQHLPQLAPSKVVGLRSRAWIQAPAAPSGSNRWVRAPRFDFPESNYLEFVGLMTTTDTSTSAGIWKFSHVASLMGILNWGYPYNQTAIEDFPMNIRNDPGVRMGDLNRDGLTDIIWSLSSTSETRDPINGTWFVYKGQNHEYQSDYGTEPPDRLADGVWINTGQGSDAVPGSAWCISTCGGDRYEIPLFTNEDAVPGFAIRRVAFGGSNGMNFHWQSASSGFLLDLNADGWLDYLNLNYHGPREIDVETHSAWLADPAGTYYQDYDLDPIAPGSVMCPLWGGCADPDYHFTTAQGSISFFDVNGDGSPDAVGDGGSYLASPLFLDRLRNVRNGMGGEVSLQYSSAIAQRDPSTSPDGLEVLAAAHANLPGVDEALGSSTGYSDRWTPVPVVSAIAATGPNIGDGSGGDAVAARFNYAQPRTHLGTRSQLGFRLTEHIRPDGSGTHHYRYQDLGRSGATAKLQVIDEGSVLFESTQEWEVLSAALPGSIAHPNVFVGRMVRATQRNLYNATVTSPGDPGAQLSTAISYDDTHGYNFVQKTITTRPTGVLRVERRPTSMNSLHIAHNVQEVSSYDAAVGGTLLGRSIFQYGYQGKPLAMSNLDMARGSTGAQLLRTTAYGYDLSNGNLIRETQLLSMGDRVTEYCYDGDDVSVAWCPSFTGQDSASVRVAVKDPLGNLSVSVPDPNRGLGVGTLTDYVDVPATRTELDPFGRPQAIFVDPVDGPEVQTVAYHYHDSALAPYSEQLSYIDAAKTQFTRTAVVSDGFGGVWKSVEGTPSGFVATAVYHNVADRQTRTTSPTQCLDGGGSADGLCAQLVGHTEPAATVVSTDGLGRVVATATPDGVAVTRYEPQTRTQGAGPSTTDRFDAILHKNAKGDLIQRLVDGDRVVWVDECGNTTAAGLSSLGGESCGGAVDSTFYTYEGSGENAMIFDPIAAATGDYTNSNHFFRYSYDTLARVIELEDPDYNQGRSSRTSYDEAGNVESVVNARAQVRQYTYDTLNRLTAISTPLGEEDYSVSYLGQELQPHVESSGNYSRTYAYDGFGRVETNRLSVSTGMGARSFLTDTVYDLVSRPIEITYPDDDTAVRYEYDDGYLQRVCDLNGESSCATTESSNAVHYIESVVYDELGRREAVNRASGSRIFEYDFATKRLTKDAFSQTEAPGYAFERNYTQYDELGNILAIAGTSSTGDVAIGAIYSYDNRNRLASWEKESPIATQPPSVVAYEYDSLGNLVNHAGDTQVFNDPERPHGIQSRNGGGVQYGYDADGNAISVLGGASSQHFKFNSANQLVCIGSSTDQNGESLCDQNVFRYDIHGQRLIDYQSAVAHTIFESPSFTYQKTGVSVNGIIEVMAFGERLGSKDVPNPALRNAVLHGLPALPSDLGRVLGVMALLGLMIVLTMAGVVPFVLAQPGTASVALVAILLLVYPPVAWAGGGGAMPTHRFELSDPLGTGMLLLDEDGNRIRHTQMTPFGAEHASVGSMHSLRKYYAGHRKHQSSGLVYMNARWFDPGSGTFLSVDPLVSDSDNPQTFNAYAYAGNNPIMRNDPTGKSQQDCYGACGGYGFYHMPDGSVLEFTFTSSETSYVENLAGEFSAQYGAASVTVNGLTPSFRGGTSSTLATPGRSKSEPASTGQSNPKIANQANGAGGSFTAAEQQDLANLAAKMKSEIGTLSPVDFAKAFDVEHMLSWDGGVEDMMLNQQVMLRDLHSMIIDGATGSIAGNMIAIRSEIIELILTGPLGAAGRSGFALEVGLVASQFTHVGRGSFAISCEIGSGCGASYTPNR